MPTAWRLTGRRRRCLHDSRRCWPRSATGRAPIPSSSTSRKLDGYRVLAFVQDGVVRLQSRRGIDLTLPFPELVAELAAQAVGSMILDGEIVALDADGRPSFNALQNRAGLKTPKEIAQAQRRLTGGVHVLRPAAFRRHQPAAEPVRRSAPLSVAMPAARRRTCSSCMRRTTPRRCTRPRSPAASKASSPSARTAAISPGALRGVAEGQGDAERGVRRRRLHAGQGRARRAGRAAARLLGAATSCTSRVTSAPASTKRASADLRQAIRDARDAQASPFAEKPPLHRPTTWVEPELVAEVNFAGWTPTGICARRCSCACATTSSAQRCSRRPGRRRVGRQAAAQGSATPPATIDDVLQQLDRQGESHRSAGRLGARIRLTNLDRVYWPGGRARDAAADHQARPAALPRARVAVHAAASRGPAAHDDPHARRHRRRALLPEALGAGAARVRRDVTVFSGHKDEQHEYLLVQQPADAAVARAGRHARVPRLAFARRSRARRDEQEHRLRELARGARSLGAQLSRLPRVRHRPVHLFGQGSEGRRARAQHEGLRERQAVAFWLRELLQRDVARGGREDLGQDRPARLRARSSAR